MKRRIASWVACVLASCVMLPGTVGANSSVGRSGSDDEVVERAVDNVVNESSPHKRYEKAAYLTSIAKALRKRGSVSLSPAAVARISALLGDSIITVRICAVESLGELGPAASSAVPALESAAARLKRDADAHYRNSTPKHRGVRDIPFRDGPSYEASLDTALHKIKSGDSGS